jgi:hypothetical protein
VKTRGAVETLQNRHGSHLSTRRKICIPSSENSVVPTLSVRNSQTVFSTARFPQLTRGELVLTEIDLSSHSPCLSTTVGEVTVKEEGGSLLPSLERLEASVEEDKTVEDLGFLISWKKSELTPSQNFLFLWEHYRTDMGLICPPEEKFVSPLQRILLFQHTKKFSEGRSNRDVKVRIREIEACCPHTRVDTRSDGTIGFHFEMGYQEKCIKDRKSYNWSLQFLRSLPLSEIPISLSHTSDKEKRILLSEEVQSLILKGAIERVQDPSTSYLRFPVFLAHFFL